MALVAVALMAVGCSGGERDDGPDSVQDEIHKHRATRPHGHRHKVVPILDCIDVRADGSRAAVLGYVNRNASAVTVPVGPKNRFSPGPSDRGQPSTFLPGRWPSQFSVDLKAPPRHGRDGRHAKPTLLTWNLQGRSLPVSPHARRCKRSLGGAAVADTTVKEAEPSANFGAEPVLEAGPGSHVLVELDRDELKRRIGPTRYVTRATLELTALSEARPSVELFVLSRSRWTELGATFRCADDADPSPTAESCAPGLGWSMARDEASELAEIVPWRPRVEERRVLGTWSGATLSFDVTRDAWNLLGTEGERRGMSFIVVLNPGASESVEIGSRESESGPEIQLELTTLPEDPSAVLRVAVDPSVVPMGTVPDPFPDGIVRQLGALEDASGVRSTFVDGELLVRVDDPSELDALASRWAGTVLRQIPPPTERPDLGVIGLVRVNPAGADTAAVAPRVRGIDNRIRSLHRFSSASALGTFAVALEEKTAGTQVSLNQTLEPAQATPTLRNWLDRNILDGEPDVAFGMTPAPGRNAFGWPGFATCHQLLADPSIPAQVASCTGTFTFPGGEFVFPTMGVADAWRALALGGRLLPGSVVATIIDRGFMPTNLDYPAGFQLVTAVTQANPGNHGDIVTMSGFGVPGNQYGGAGPGGPVARVNGMLTGLTADEFTFTLRAAPLFGSQVISMSLLGDNTFLQDVFDFKPVGLEEFEVGDPFHSVPVFAAAGNQGIDVDEECCIPYIGVCWECESHEPCENDGIHCVGGLDYDSSSRDPASNWGSDGSVDFVAPFHPIALSNPTTGTMAATNGGTSFATPFVAGIASLLFAAKPEANAAEVIRCLYEGSGRMRFGEGPSNEPQALRSLRCMYGKHRVFGDFDPAVTILDPLDGLTVPAGSVIAVRALAVDYEDGELSVTWGSDLDGFRGQTFSDLPGFILLSTEGTHRLTASAVDGAGQAAQDSVLVNVGTTPFNVAIVRPLTDGAVFSTFDSVTFTATGSRTGITPPAGDFAWRAVRDSDGLEAFTAAGISVGKSFEAPGEYTVTVTRTLGASSVQASRRISVVDTPGLRVVITSPEPGLSGEGFLTGGQPNLLEAEANFTAASFDWTLTLIGSGATLSLGSGNPLTWTALGSCFLPAILSVTATPADPSAGSAVFDSLLVVIHDPTRVGCGDE